MKRLLNVFMAGLFVVAAGNGCNGSEQDKGKMSAKLAGSWTVESRSEVSPEDAGEAEPAVKEGVNEGEPLVKKVGHLTADKLVLDFGMVEPSTSVKGEFTLRNDGTDVLEIKRAVRKSCGCTDPQVGKYKLAPGESTWLRITYRSSQQPGTSHKKVWVDVAPPGTPGTLTLEIKANVKKHIDVKPAKLEFELRDPLPESAPLVLESSKDVVFSVADYTCTQEAVTLKFDPNAKASRHVIEVAVDVDKLRQIKGSGTLTITVKHPKVTQVSVPFSITRPFSALPKVRRFQNLRAGAPDTSTVKIVSNFKEPFELGEITSKSGMLEVVGQEREENGYKLEVAMTPPKKGETSFPHDYLIVKIKDHPEDTLEVHCYGKVRPK